jgi:hypothetical protein
MARSSRTLGHAQQAMDLRKLKTLIELVDFRHRRAQIQEGEERVGSRVAGSETHGAMPPRHRPQPYISLRARAALPQRQPKQPPSRS